MSAHADTFSSSFLGDEARHWVKKGDCLKVEGEFVEKGPISGLEVVTTRQHTFSVLIDIGLGGRTAIRFHPAKTLRLGPPQSYAYWNAKMVFDGTTWIVTETPKSSDIESELLNEFKKLSLSYKRPLELGDAARSLLSFGFVIPWKIVLPHRGQPTSLVELVETNGATISFNGGTGLVEIEVSDSCSNRKVVLDQSRQFALKSIVINSDLCGNEKMEPGLLDETTVHEWRKVEGLHVPVRVTRSLSRGKVILAESEINITDVKLVPITVFENEIAEASAGLKSGVELIDERTGGQYFIDKNTIRVEQLR